VAKVIITGVHGHQLMILFTNTVKHADKKWLETILIERKTPKENTLENNS
jgi:hypothetical protein